MCSVRGAVKINGQLYSGTIRVYEVLSNRPSARVLQPLIHNVIKNQNGGAASSQIQAESVSAASIETKTK